MALAPHYMAAAEIMPASTETPLPRGSHPYMVRGPWRTGPNAKRLSAKTVTRLKADWWTDYEAWQKRDLWQPALSLHLGGWRL